VHTKRSESLIQSSSILRANLKLRAGVSHIAREETTCLYFRNIETSREVNGEGMRAECWRWK